MPANLLDLVALVALVLLGLSATTKVVDIGGSAGLPQHLTSSSGGLLHGFDNFFGGIT